MDKATAAQVRAAPALKTMQGKENVNRVVETRTRFGTVIDRRPKPRLNTSLDVAPGFFPLSFHEHEVLRELNRASAEFAPRIHYADALGMIVEYIEGSAGSAQEWRGSAPIRQDSIRDMPKILRRLAELSPEVFPGDLPPEERPYWRDDLTVGQYADVMKDRTMRTWLRIVNDETADLLRGYGSVESPREQLEGVAPSGDRKLILLHNDAHHANTVRRSSDDQLMLIDWTLAGPGDVAWAATTMSEQLNDEERDQLLANVKRELPNEAVAGLDQDWDAYEKIRRERQRTVKAWNLAEIAAQTLAASAVSPAAASQVIADNSESIHNAASQFMGVKMADCDKAEVIAVMQNHVDRVIAKRTGTGGPPAVIDLAQAPGARPAASRVPGRAAQNSRPQELDSAGPPVDPPAIATPPSTGFAVATPGFGAPGGIPVRPPVARDLPVAAPTAGNSPRQGLHKGRSLEPGH